MDATFKKYKVKYLGTSIKANTQLWNYCYGDRRRTIIVSIDKKDDNSPAAFCISYSFPKDDIVTDDFRNGLLDWAGMDLSKPIERFEGYQRMGSPYSNTQFNIQPVADMKKCPAFT